MIVIVIVIVVVLVFVLARVLVRVLAHAHDYENVYEDDWGGLCAAAMFEESAWSHGEAAAEPGEDLGALLERDGDAGLGRGHQAVEHFVVDRVLPV